MVKFLFLNFSSNLSGKFVRIATLIIFIFRQPIATTKPPTQAPYHFVEYEEIEIITAPPLGGTRHYGPTYEVQVSYLLKRCFFKISKNFEIYPCRSVRTSIPYPSIQNISIGDAAVPARVEINFMFLHKKHTLNTCCI